MPRFVQSFDGFRFGDYDGQGYAYIDRHQDRHWFTTGPQTPLLDLSSKKYSYDDAQDVLVQLRASTGKPWELPDLSLLSKLMEQCLHSRLRDTFDTSRLGWILSSSFERAVSPNGKIKYPDLIGVSRAKDGCVSYTHRSLAPAEIRPVFSCPI